MPVWAAKQTARHILHERKLHHKKRSEWWREERRKTVGDVIIHQDMMTIPRYVSMVTDCIEYGVLGSMGNIKPSMRFKRTDSFG